MIWYIVCTTFVLFFCIPSENRPSEVRVNITHGTVIGSFDSYYKFYGIPYADSTAGVNRFQPPKPSPRFRDPFVANRQNITCLRPTRDGYDGIEDCLSLNVISPTVDHTRKLPVMVWIKGREINNFDPAFKNIIEKDVVVVTPNFRESVFGFLCLGTSKAPGNAGLKDIIAALKWIQQNIAAFGGDPHNVTIFGHGSGASIVDLLTLSLSSKGLFHKAIAQSGTAMAPWAVTRDNLLNAIKVAEALGHYVEDVNRLSDIFTRVRASALMAVINELESDNLLDFAPCIERVISDDNEPFLLKSPYQIFNAGEQLDVPFMTGFVDKEGAVVQESLIKDWFGIVNLQKDLNFNTEEEKQKITEQIKAFYSLNNSIEKDLYVTLAGDVMVYISTLRESHIRALTRTTPIYLYQFSYKGNLGKGLVEDDYSTKSVHGQELAYLFYENSYEACTAYDLAIAGMVVERWTNFAKTGMPTSETSSTDWQPFTKNNKYYLKIWNENDVPTTYNVRTNDASSLDILLRDPYTKTLAFWQDIYDKYFIDARSRWDIIHSDQDKDSIDITDDEYINNHTKGESFVEMYENMDNYVKDNKTEIEYHCINSTSTVIGFTLVVVSLLSIVNNLETSEIML
ncbi:unnamed protein product [Pieris brassicae]|uniref:Carboxylesterase type B domain-containing protein n=1 Tax=Pieris brassicae TaxID=7116 RepID=A0A9P0T0H1_PIEBR|nr:unnamed protein product [Pieris brassicae]